MKLRFSQQEKTPFFCFFKKMTFRFLSILIAIGIKPTALETGQGKLQEMVSQTPIPRE